MLSLPLAIDRRLDKTPSRVKRTDFPRRTLRRSLAAFLITPDGMLDRKHFRKIMEVIPVYVDPAGYKTDAALAKWVQRSVDFVFGLAAETSAAARPRKRPAKR